MGGNINHREFTPHWSAQGTLNLPRKLHEMPREFDKFLSKFDLDKYRSPEDHLNNFFLATIISLKFPTPAYMSLALLLAYFDKALLRSSS
jgi:hypothetical protein